MRTWFMTLAAAVLCVPVSAAVKTQDVKYTVDQTEYIGYLAYDDGNAAMRPGILIAPEWVGLNDYSRGRARQLAEMGYVAFVFDPYGGGKNAADVKQSAEWSGALKADRPELRKRITGALETLRKQDRVDPTKIAAIGYCFGGTTVLELARSGADVQGVVSFHGGLSTTMPAKAGEMKAKVLVCHGAVDPFVPPAEVAAFEKEMQDAKADWQLISYGNAVHSFTNPAAKGQIPGAQYEEKADKRSWEAMKGFLTELFNARMPWKAAARQPANEPPAAFGTTKNFRRMVFICDASAVTINRMGTIKFELSRAISALEPTQSLIAATPDAKRRFYTFLEDVEVGGGGVSTDAAPALEAALRQKPEIAHLLCGSGSIDLKGYSRLSSVLERANAGKATRVHTIACHSEGDMLTGPALEQLASDNGGRFRWLIEDAQ